MFRNQAQRSQAIRTLLKTVELEFIWGSDGPTKQAVAVFSSSRLSAGEDIIVRAAFDLWNNSGQCRLSAVLYSLDVKISYLLLSLILAMQNDDSGESVDKWIAEASGK